MTPDDLLRARACYGQLRLTARSWAGTEAPINWRSVDHVLALLAVEVALPDCVGKAQVEVERVLHREPDIHPRSEAARA